MKVIERIDRGSLLYVDESGNEIYSWTQLDEAIVRCRDCKYFGERFKQCNRHSVLGGFANVKPDGFCAWGERRDT